MESGLSPVLMSKLERRTSYQLEGGGENAGARRGGRLAARVIPPLLLVQRRGLHWKTRSCEADSRRGIFVQ